MGEAMKKIESYDLKRGGREAHYALAQFTNEEITQFWPGLEEMLDRIPHTWTHWTKEWILQSLYSGTLQMWGVGPPPKAVLVFFTQICIYPAERVLLVPWGAGSFKRAMLPLIEATLVQYAQTSECVRVEVRGRPGWGPHFQSIGMKREFVTWSYPVPSVRIN